ncbi:hypothetical protein ANFP_22840 [Acidithiobacillus ferrooxidans]|nr:hypothetical protein ANFP_22840 [Acidithiobacillus ferrooxidans]
MAALNMTVKRDAKKAARLTFTLGFMMGSGLRDQSRYGVTDGMDASPYTGPAAGSFRRESSLEPDGIKVPKWKFTHAKDKEDSSWRLQPMDWIWQSRSCSCTG